MGSLIFHRQSLHNLVVLLDLIADLTDSERIFTQSARIELTSYIDVTIQRIMLNIIQRSMK